jgi:hypothetical protein
MVQEILDRVIRDQSLCRTSACLFIHRDRWSDEQRDHADDVKHGTHRISSMNGGERVLTGDLTALYLPSVLLTIAIALVAFGQPA